LTGVTIAEQSSPFDQSICAAKQGWWHSKTYRLCGFDINDELKSGGELYG
jgi:hypothetical protein